MYQYPDYLMHYGVKGMKWGVRKARKNNYFSKAAKKRRSSYSQDYKDAEKLRKKSYKQLSNSELKSLNKRLELEANYKRLNPKGIDKGKRMVSYGIGLLGTAGSVYALRNAPLTQLGKSIINLKIRGQKQLGTGR